MRAANGLCLAASPTTWGVDFADDPANPPWQQVLDQVAASPLDALELGPVGYLPDDPARLCRALESRKLTAVGSFVFEDLHDPAAAEHAVEVAERATRAIAAAGGRVLVVIDRPGPERAATAGRSQAARRLRSDEWRAMLGTIGDVFAVAAAHGLRAAFHPHAGSFVEFLDEVERLVTDSNVDLCLDTGHIAYAGMIPEALLAEYAPRLAHVHLKDVRPAIIEQARVHGLGFWQAVQRGVFCPLGEGTVNVSAVVGTLREIGYKGCATIEQDRVAGSGTPLGDLQQSVAVVRTAEACD